MKKVGQNRIRISASVFVFALAFIISATCVFYLHKTDKLSEIVDGFFDTSGEEITEELRLYPAQESQQSHTLSMPDESTIGHLLKCKTYTLDEICKNPEFTVNQSLILVNTKNKIPDDYPADIVEYNDTGVLMNSCITKAYAELSAAIREKFGQKLYISSSYRSAEEQAAVIIEVGPETATEVGASEHQTGLALDIYVAQFSGDRFIGCDAGKYVNSNCGDFGFIIRYPADKVDVTGIRFEPWHIRYVGKPHSKIISQQGLAFEEYVESYEMGAFYSFEDYVVSRQKADGDIKIPVGAKNVTVSEDNMGGVFVTAYYGQ